MWTHDLVVATVQDVAQLHEVSGSPCPVAVLGPHCVFWH